ncbi:MAG: hypothetical protein QXK21_02705 [Candidatus Micrarchaeia archaeon]
MALKKIERKISWDIYLTAFVISLVIFSIGVWFGLQIEKTVYEQMIEKIANLNNHIIAVGNLLLLENDESYCEYIKSEIVKFDEETYELGKQIEFMEDRRGIDEEVKINYMELEFRDYLLAKKVNQICGEKQNLILYFVNSETCQNCKEQGEIITSARTKTNTKVYTFDLSINTSLVNALKKRYGIKDVSLPIIIINDEINFGFMNEEEIISKLN